MSRETVDLLQTLIALQNRIEEEDENGPCFEGIRRLAVENGPRDQLQEALEQLAEKLEPKSGVRGTAQVLMWTVDKKYCDDILKTIERVKSSISLALQGQV